MSPNPEILAGTHLAAFLLGAFVCWRVVLRFGPRVAAKLSEDRMDQTPPDERGQWRPSLFAVLVIVALFVVIVVGGLQARSWQQQASDSAEKLADAVKVSDTQRGCLSRWAQDLTDTITARSEGNADLRTAETRKDNADDAVTDVFVEAFLTDPPPPKDVLEQHFTDALTEYSAAKAHLAQVRADVAATTAQNPYPVLNLDCANPLEASP